MNVSLPHIQRDGILLELELEIVLSCLTWMLGIESIPLQEQNLQNLITEYLLSLQKYF